MGNITIPPPPAGGYEWPIPIETASQDTMIGTSAVALIIPTLLVGLRVYAKRLGGRSHDWADYTILLALFFNYGMQTTGWLLVTKGGLGFPIVEVLARFGPDRATFFYNAIIAFSLLWNFTTMLSKLSMLFLFTSIMPVRAMRIPAWFTMGFVVISHTCYIIAQFALCPSFPDSWNPVVGGQCKPINLYYFIMGFTNILVDVVILILPMPFIYSLKLARAKKASLVAVFAVGFITCALAIYRQVVLPELTFDDLTGSGLTATVFSGLEPAVAIALACVPYLRLLFVNIHTPSTFLGTGTDPYALPYGPRTTLGGRGGSLRDRDHHWGNGGGMRPKRSAETGLTTIDAMSEFNPSELQLHIVATSSSTIDGDEKFHFTTAAELIAATGGGGGGDSASDSDGPDGLPSGAVRTDTPVPPVPAVPDLDGFVPASISGDTGRVRDRSRGGSHDRSRTRGGSVGGSVRGGEKRTRTPDDHVLVIQKTVEIEQVWEVQPTR